MTSITPARIFVPMALLFGCLLVIATPPLQSPDEYNHFFRAFQISEGNFYPKKLNGNRLGEDLPVSLYAFKTAFTPMIYDYGSRTSYSEMKSVLALSLQPQYKEFTDFPNTAIYAPTSYLPQALGIFFARYFTDRVLLLFYAARLFNLVCWIFLVWAALRLMPFQRQTMAALALLPASLAIAASCSADVFSNGLAFYAIAFFCRECTLNVGEKAKSTNYAFGATMIVALNKLVFVPLALLSLLKEFRRKIDWKIFLRPALMPLLLCFAVAVWWGVKANEWFIPYDKYDQEVRHLQTLNPGVNPSEQISFVFSNLFSFVKTVAVSVIRTAPSTAAHLVGKFGWEKNYLPVWMLALLWMALIILVFSEKNMLNPYQRVWLSGIILCCIILWALTMYALWCPVGAPELDNWQGRYFVPLAPLITMAIGVGWGQRLEKNNTVFSLMILVSGEAMLIYNVLARYWL